MLASWEWLWMDGLAKQVSGFTILGLSCLAVLLSARKRWRWSWLGPYSFWRIAHVVLGTGMLIGLCVHTGLRMGSNLNAALMYTMMGLSVFGAVYAWLSAQLQRLGGRSLRRLTSLVSMVHIALTFSVFPLVGFHIYTVYAY